MSLNPNPSACEALNMPAVFFTSPKPEEVLKSNPFAKAQRQEEEGKPRRIMCKSFFFFLPAHFPPSPWPENGVVGGAGGDVSTDDYQN